MFLRRLIPILLLLTVSPLRAAPSSSDVRLNEIQVIGTHNSYHLQPAPAVMALIKSANADAASSIAYSHKPLHDQLGRLGIRQLEWDLFADPEGGLYADPAAPKLIETQGGDPGPSHDPNGALKQPGLKILHSPDFDFLSTSLTFKQALTSLRDWSEARPGHVPIMVLIEVKETSGSPIGVKPLKFDATQLDGIDLEILSVFQRDSILTPDDVRGDTDTLREAILTKGWPSLNAVRGKVLFALDNGGEVRDRYLDDHPSLRDRVLFASVSEEDSAAAWFKLNNPVQDFDEIQRLVRKGYLVRTRADAGTIQARENDPAQRDLAFASGAQFISTDYPEPDTALSDYNVRFPNDIVARPNPIIGQTSLGDIELDKAGDWIVCQGTYGGHLQGVATDGKALYWSHTVQLVKTDLEGNVLQKIEVPDHHGDLTLHDGKVFVAMEYGQFNAPAGASDPWVFVYDAESLALLSKHRVPELVHGAGGIAYHDGRFILVGGLPGHRQRNFVFEYDDRFTFLERHELPSKQTKLGIQTATYMDGHWWFGCYGSPKNPGLLKADANFKLVGQSQTNFSYGIARLDTDTILRGECFANDRRGKIEVRRESTPPVTPISTTPIRFATYNVLFGNWGDPESIGELFRPYDLDIIAFNEVPDGDWTARVGQVLGMDHSCVGQSSSANHPDKYKSILSRTPLTNRHEIPLTRHQGWSPASLVGAETVVHGIPLLVYSTHIPGQEEADGSAAESIADAITEHTKGTGKNIILLGDLNNLPGSAPLAKLENAGLRLMWTDLGIPTSTLSSHRHIESGQESGVIDHAYFTGPTMPKATEGGILYNAFNPPSTDKVMTRYQAEWERYNKPLSDHRPVWGVLEFPPAD